MRKTSPALKRNQVLSMQEPEGRCLEDISEISKKLPITGLKVRKYKLLISKEFLDPCSRKAP